MGALTRVLQEEYKKSMDLTFNILRLGYVIFLSYYILNIILCYYSEYFWRSPTLQRCIV